MILFDQECIHDPESGVFGDCARACIRTVAQDPMPLLPHPIAPSGGEWNLEFFDTLEDLYGWAHQTMVYHPTRDFAPLPRVIMAAGPTVRTKPETGGPLHLVVWDRLAGRMVHDPHPSRAGLISITAVDWLQPLDPAT
ncbi:hypothetical protein [Salipiger sp.]|uniref:hypothetical protein n=1 Tax=Salipiger sp. TaxID=2078585 RepID=UPI003A96CC76